MDLSRYLEHTLLRADACISDVKNLCNEAKKYGFFSVCVNPFWVKDCKKFLKNSGVKICATVGFPLGANKTEVKTLEAVIAAGDGADELDMVINIGALKSGDMKTLYDDIRSVVTHAGKRPVKVIIEACSLTKKEKITVVKLAVKAGASFIKTSTGFGNGGATQPDIRLIRKAADGKIKIKAAGGIRNYEEALDLISAGADRIGSSAGADIMRKIGKKGGAC
ncbi:deoxyribose-phosphate aldolase [bacterium]|jgi:deoxyribose-phosphate aldolase|nr:deoxyribose-phosphate aldolase [bacterium]